MYSMYRIDIYIMLCLYSFSYLSTTIFNYFTYPIYCAYQYILRPHSMVVIPTLSCVCYYIIYIYTKLVFKTDRTNILRLLQINSVILCVSNIWLKDFHLPQTRHLLFLICEGLPQLVVFKTTNYDVESPTDTCFGQLILQLFVKTDHTLSISFFVLCHILLVKTAWITWRGQLRTQLLCVTRDLFTEITAWEVAVWIYTPRQLPTYNDLPTYSLSAHI